MKYRQRAKRGRIIPFGYKVNQYDPKLLDPIEKELELLEQALLFMRTCSLREVHRWLKHKSGRNISVMGLWSIHKKTKAKQNAKYYENRKKADARRKLEEADRQQRRAIAEAKEAERVHTQPGNGSQTRTG